MLYSSIDFENLMNYRTSQFQLEAAQHRLARQILRGSQTQPSTPTSLFDGILLVLGGLLVTAGGSLQRRAGCRPLEEAA